MPAISNKYIMSVIQTKKNGLWIFLLVSQAQIHILSETREHKSYVIFILKFNYLVKSFLLKLKICNIVPEKVI